VALKETRDLKNIEIEELQHTLEAHEYRFNERRQVKNMFSRLKPMENTIEKVVSRKETNKSCLDKKTVM